MSVDLLNGLVAWYNMKETIWTGAAREVKDASGNGNHGQAMNGANTTSSGKVGRGAFFDAAQSQYVDCGNSPTLTTGLDVFTAAAWVDCNQAGFRPLLGFSSSNAPSLAIDWNSGRPLIYLGLNNYRYFDASVQGTGTRLVVFEIPGNGQTAIENARLWVDNVEMAPWTTVSTGPQNAKALCWIGRTGTTYFNNLIDELGIWSRKLTAEELTYLYQSGNGLTIDLVRTVLPIGADSIRQKVVDALDARLKTITVANGYETDLGNNVFAWRDHAFADSELPGLLYQDYDSDPVPEALGSVERRLKIRIEVAAAETQTVSAPVLLRKALADVEKAIGSDIYFDGLVENTTLIMDVSEVEQTSRKHMAARLEFEILYTTERFNPYL